MKREDLPKEVVKFEKIAAKRLEKLKKRQYDFAFSSSSGSYAPHVYHVFNDPDFQTAVRQLRETLEKLYYKDISLTTSPTDEHLLEEDRKHIKLLADEYCITLDDFGTYADGYFAAGYDYGKRIEEFGGLGMGYDGDHFMCYVIGPKTTIEQINEDWNFIKGIRPLWVGNENTKSKSPQSPELIYAIFKARGKDKLKFSEIFRLYQSGKLKGYEFKNTKQFSSEDSLERYYRKYKPEIQNTNIVAPPIPVYKKQ